MLILDMRWTGFIALIAVLGCVTIFLSTVLQQQKRIASLQPQLNFPDALTKAPFGLLLLQQDRITYANPRAVSLLGLTPGTAILPDSEWATLLRSDAIAARVDSAKQGIYRSVVLSAERNVTWWVVRGTGVEVVFVLDLSEQHHIQQQTNALIHDLGHELRTPIAAILTHIEILGFTDVSPDIQQQSLTLTRGEVQRLSRLVDDLLTLGRVSTSSGLKHRPVDLIQLVEGVLTQITPMAENHGAIVSLEAFEDLQYVNVDQDQIRQVFLNLIDNAVKYGGQDVRVTLRMAQDQHGLSCSVCDDGPGIPAQHLPRVTERFYRISRTGVEGSGLGLALAKEILRQHQSELSIMSPVRGDRGTCVRFTLPFGEDK